MPWMAHADLAGVQLVTQEQFDLLYAPLGWFTTTPPPEDTTVAPSTWLHWAGPWSPLTFYTQGDLITSPGWGFLLCLIDLTTDTDFSETGFLRMTPDATTGSGSVLDFVQPSGRTGVTITGNADPILSALLTWFDHLGNRIAEMINAGGLFMNDRIRLVRDWNSQGHPNFSADIYGYLGYGDPLSMCDRHAGPPGNALDYKTATGDTFDFDRAGDFGAWVSTGGVSPLSSPVSPFGNRVNPARVQHIVQLTQTIGSAMSIQTSSDPSVAPVCEPGNYVKALVAMRSAVTTRTITPTLTFLDASGATVLGSIVGATFTSVAGAWTVGVVGGIVPPSATGIVRLDLAGTGFAASEIHYLTAAGIWVNNSTMAATDPNPNNVWARPFTGQNDGTNGWLYACAGDQVDDTSAQLSYLLQGTPGVYYLPAQVGAPGSTSSPCWVQQGGTIDGGSP